MRLPKIPIGLLLILTLIAVLRIPTLFEPYWYGDEQIYLAIAQAMQRGAVLYRDIWDNKPPLLYALYAISPTLFWAKVLASVFVLGSCVGIYKLSRKLFKDKHSIYSLLTTALVGIFLSVPRLEGTIANAELFFTLPTIWAAYLVTTLRGTKNDWPRLVTIGLLAACAFLLKVPALFDFLGMFLFVAIYLGEIFGTREKWRDLIVVLLRTFMPIGVAFGLPIALVFGYFFLNGALADFIIASFSQNASYVSVDSGPLSKLNNPLFIKGIILLVGCLVLGISYFKKILSKELLLLTLWFGFSLYGSLLSNRPYLHYLLQAVPPTVLLVFYLSYNLIKERRTAVGAIVVAVMLFMSTVYVEKMFRGAFHLPFKPYYLNFYEFASERKPWEDYAAFFDRRTLNSYKIGDYLRKKSNPDDTLFVWGDAASIYVLANRPAATRFIQSHHLTTIDPKNYDLIIARLSEIEPKFIIIDRPVHFQFPKLEELVDSNYEEVAVFEDLHIYRLN